MPILEHDEYVEQAHFFRALGERLREAVPLQELLAQMREEILATTKLPLAIDFLLGELKHLGVIGTAMAHLPHYFTSFQTYLVQEAEDDRGRFDLRMALAILRHEAEYRAEGAAAQGLFLYQFETLCRNRLRYEKGLDAVAQDPLYDADWRAWIQTVRRQVGIIDFADLVYVRSQHYVTQQARHRKAVPVDRPILFGEKEGKIALANRHKDPLYLFASLQRHLGYPQVPRPAPPDETRQLLPLLKRQVERLEVRVKLLEDEQRGGIDLSKFYDRGNGLRPVDPPTSDG